MSDTEFMRHAIALGERNATAGDGGPFGAVIVMDGAVVGEGWNQVTARNDPTAHAEVVAIRDACARLGTFDLSGAAIYTSCEPCPMCLGAILWARLDRMYYAADRADAAAVGFDDEWFYVQVAKDVGERELVADQLLADEAREVLTTWLENPDRIEY